ncbi:MAG: tRNA lysidine(34) synthetase TilS [Rhodanobacter sp.]
MSLLLPEHLRAALAKYPAPSLCVAFSGGPDSTALLHALAQLPEARQRGLRALHVNHGLQDTSDAWAEHCQRVCHSLQLPCDVLRVQVERSSGMGLEAAARNARYSALAGQLHDGEWLLLGHHRDDQVETVLLKLLRGAGPEGLGGMRELRPFGHSQLWRPLLDLPRQQLLDYVDALQLPFIDDPSNADTKLARNQLRHEILPRLERYWPQTAASILHSAALSRAAADTLKAQWLISLESLRDPATDSLSVAGWLALASALREPLLDHWLRSRGLPAPTAAQRRQIERQCSARADKLPIIRWPGAELHIWKQRLWALRSAMALEDRWETSWHGELIVLPDGGSLALRAIDARLTQPLTVRTRRGGEHIKPAGDAHTRELRDLFQRGQIPPWQRDACPLIYANNELIAVADRWISARGNALFAISKTLPQWQPGR